jgi:hypothetical protein
MGGLPKAALLILPVIPESSAFEHPQRFEPCHGAREPRSRTRPDDFIDVFVGFGLALLLYLFRGGKLHVDTHHRARPRDRKPAEVLA